MAGLREGQDVLVRFGMAVAGLNQINGGALHGPRVWEISHHAVFMSTRGHSTTAETLSPTRLCPLCLVHNLRAQPIGK